MLPYLYSRLPSKAATGCNVARRFFTFQAGDFCMLREMKSNRKYLIGPLEQGMQKDHKGGRINHEELMGKPIRSIVRTHNGKGIYLLCINPVIHSRDTLLDAYGFMLHKPTLEEYVLNVPRACTPVYTKDASSIVSRMKRIGESVFIMIQVQMLDIEPGNRILEAGTGNGALTLYLARAVSSQGRVDTFDIRETHSNAAKKHVQRYDRGRFKDVVSFHLGDVADHVTHLADNSHEKDIFDGIMLDMPEPNKTIEALLPYLRNDRFIVCYLPNMTQVLDLVQATRGLPVIMESCIETEWKEWDVRATHIRSTDETAWICRPKNFDVKGHTAFLTKLRKTA